MNDDPKRVVYVYGEPAVVEEPVEKKRPPRAGRLIGAALIALILAGAAVFFGPKLLKKLSPQPSGAQSATVASAPPDTEPLPAVQVAWEKLDLGTMPAGVAQNLNSGKFYYDNRFPGNFGLAIGYWKRALDSLSDSRDSGSEDRAESRIPNPESRENAGADRSGVQGLVASAEKELACQFSTDSGDVAVLIKQGKKDLALILLEKMRADFLDVTAPQYAWASAMLSRLRR